MCFHVLVTSFHDLTARNELEGGDEYIDITITSPHKVINPHSGFKWERSLFQRFDPNYLNSLDLGLLKCRSPNQDLRGKISSKTPDWLFAVKLTFFIVKQL